MHEQLEGGLYFEEFQTLGFCFSLMYWKNRRFFRSENIYDTIIKGQIEN